MCGVLVVAVVEYNKDERRKISLRISILVSYDAEN